MRRAMNNIGLGQRAPSSGVPTARPAIAHFVGARMPGPGPRPGLPFGFPVPRRADECFNPTNKPGVCCEPDSNNPGGYVCTGPGGTLIIKPPPKPPPPAGAPGPGQPCGPGSTCAPFSHCVNGICLPDKFTFG